MEQTIYNLQNTRNKQKPLKEKSKLEKILFWTGTILIASSLAIYSGYKITQKYQKAKATGAAIGESIGKINY